MSREIANTGGNKEFHYTKEDLKRIESQDTESTREFKAALKEWREKKRKRRFPILKFNSEQKSLTDHFEESGKINNPGKESTEPVPQNELPLHLKVKRWGRNTKQKVLDFFKR